MRAKKNPVPGKGNRVEKDGEEDPSLNPNAPLKQRLTLPEPLGRGKVKPERRHRYDAQLEVWCAGLLELRPRIEKDPGVRGWCYILEVYGTLAKGDFDRAEKLIGECRKNGLLPLDFTTDDDGGKSAFSHVEEVEDRTPDEQAIVIANYVNQAEEYWDPVSFWDFQDCYLESVVEKSALKTARQYRRLVVDQHAGRHAQAVRLLAVTGEALHSTLRHGSRPERIPDGRGAEEEPRRYPPFIPPYLSRRSRLRPR